MMRKSTLFIILIFLIQALFSCVPSNRILNYKIEEAKLDRVIDGDTISVIIGDKKERVRMLEINCEESVKEMGKKVTSKGIAASAFTKQLLKDVDIVYLTKDKSNKDQYGRLLRLVWLEKPTDIYNKEELRNKCVNAILLLKGYAKVVKFDDDSYIEIFKKFEKEGRNGEQ